MQLNLNHPSFGRRRTRAMAFKMRSVTNENSGFAVVISFLGSTKPWPNARETSLVRVRPNKMGLASTLLFPPFFPCRSHFDAILHVQGKGKGRTWSELDLIYPYLVHPSGRGSGFSLPQSTVAFFPILSRLAGTLVHSPRHHHSCLEKCSLAVYKIIMTSKLVRGI